MYRDIGWFVGFLKKIRKVNVFTKRGIKINKIPFFKKKGKVSAYR
jgi:beta-lactamase class D